MGGIEELNISVEPHLIKVLQPLPSLLPRAIAAQLSPYINDAEKRPPSTHTIPYSLLLQISQWSRTSSGLEALQKNTPPLDQASYSMIVLLAGTRTSPEKRFPPYVSKDPHTESKRAADDKKAISAVLNAVLSVVGSGFATWWASARTGWRVEWVRCVSSILSSST
ncbi:hypothetical protein SERLA73DRAFT_140198 [Serpula lacrymans var. lacrymans S7.3]|uniref:Uncharacterized protein n=1 Tax=Serpula lacrymans var. lacrymans (strain S7.3) TaxID=936435 RepID=F8Q4V1_SERL3|nr:hypothetical protein SERLA73DRAFT_140198 [Serpula lacrymans var. lacrymans S7.3]